MLVDDNGNPIFDPTVDTTGRVAPAPVPRSAPAPAAPQTLSQQQTAYAAQTYGYLASYLTDPTIGPILIKAAQQGWDEATLEGALSKTAWWQQTSADARKFDALQATDPASAQAQVQQMAAAAQTMAGSLGVTLDPSRLQSLATEAARMNWSTDQMKQALVSEGNYDPTKAAGATATTLVQLQQSAGEYGVPISQQTMQSWLRQINSGVQNVDGFKVYLQQQAKSLYPTMAAAIDQGVTPSQYFDPYRQMAAKTLGLAPDSIDFTDPKWQTLLMTTDDKGNRIPMTLDQAQRYIKATPTYGYQFSDNGRNDAYNLLANIGQAMGKVPGT